MELCLYHIHYKDMYQVLYMYAHLKIRLAK